MKISAVIPTRGDVDLEPILSKLHEYPEIVDVAVIQGDSVFNRYLAAAGCSQEVIYTQDDDCITDIRPLLEAYAPGVIVNAMTPQHAAHYRGRITLVGFGAMFDRSMVHVLDSWERDPLFLREADRVFTALHPHRTIFPKIEILPAANNSDRLWRRPEHVASRVAIEQRIFEVTGIQP